ncbi:hypothetical protein Ciccas_002477 [Cichlidogyrus casuarinus]|uniref:Uncharacterized protein n=1 Tax=Cichlidogyrus casuarinus TaxID=1844966 RepID=A0ABD2QH42_9PLAT
MNPPLAPENEQNLNLDATYSDEILSPNASNTQDPELAKSLKLAKKLQERELFQLSSESSSSASFSSAEEDFDFAEMNRNEQLSVFTKIVLRAETFSRKQSLMVSNEDKPRISRFNKTNRRQKYQRSQSCRFTSFEPREQNKLVYPPDDSYYLPPRVLRFHFFFNCEFDEVGGITYGSGGALLSTLMRIIKRLHGIREMEIVDIFLTVRDSRQLLHAVEQMAAKTLETLNLTNLSKLISLADIERDNRALHEHHPEEQEPVLGNYSRLDEIGGDLTRTIESRWWFLREVRWLTARPKLFSWNPLCDIASAFSNLRTLTLSVSQLTSAMLMRLVYQTPLQRIILIRVSTHHTTH